MFWKTDAEAARLWWEGATPKLRDSGGKERSRLWRARHLTELSCRHSVKQRTRDT